MRIKFITTVVSFSLAATLAGCSSSSNQTANTNAANPTTANTNTVNTTNPTINSNTTVQNPTTQTSPPVGQDPTRNTEIKPNPPSPGLDNSEVSTAMNPDGSVTETRVFKNHSVISKVVRLTDTKIQKSVKVYDKKGTVKDLSKDNIEQAMQMSGDDLARAVGFMAKGKETTEERKEGVKDKTEDAVDKGKQVGGEVVDKTKEGAKTVADKTKEGVKKVGNKVKGTIKP